MDKQILFENLPSFRHMIALIHLNYKVTEFESKDGITFIFEDLTKFEMDNLNEIIQNRLPFLLKS